MKSPGNKNKLIIDEIAGAVVRDIYKWKLIGMSQQGIADKLNSLGVLSPLEYKKSLGMGCSAAFRVNPRAKWSANSVKRILCDEVYTGVLIQGKMTTPNYKVKRAVRKDKSEWVRIENSHEAIISKDEFALVADLLGRDTYKTEIYPFSGMLYCFNCRQSLIRKISTVGGVKYINHACIKKHAADKRGGCSGVRIKEADLYEIVTAALKNYIKSISDIEQYMKYLDEIPQKEAEARKLESQIDAKKGEIAKIESRKLRLYEDYSDKKITVEEYDIFRENYNIKISEAEDALVSLQKEIAKCLPKKEHDNACRIDYIKEYSDFTELSREIVVKFIDKMIVYEGGRLEIVFRYKDDYEEILSSIRTHSDFNREV
jgi:hypothetical protein